MTWRLGIDIGGTFTDFVLMNVNSGEMIMRKVPSTREDPADAVLAGLKMFEQENGVSPSDIEYLGHGSTVATNTLIERTGTEAGLLVTDGFADILEIGRVALQDVADVQAVKPPALVARPFVGTVRERVTADGAVRQPLDVQAMLGTVEDLMGRGVKALAICFLHAYRFPNHERDAKAAIERSFPSLAVWISSDIWPEIREYERAIVTVINAYIGPRCKSYYLSLEKRSRAVGFNGSLLLSQGNGGLLSASSAAARPIATLQSGPASGAAAANYLGHVAGYERLIALDIGGTSTDVAILDRGLPYTTDSHIGDFPVIVPLVEVSSIGAGGGSVAWVDSSGVLKVGPKSAGAYPGPACYGRGGTEATLTDAYVGSGIISPTGFLGGTTTLDADAAMRALDRTGSLIERSAEKAAEAIIDIATAKMYAEVVRLIAKKGVDVSEFGLILYGGAGPTHGFLLAKELGINKVIVPSAPGLLCALGTLTTDIKSDFIETVHALIAGESSKGMDGVALAYRALEKRADRWLDEHRVFQNDRAFIRYADMRYKGQSFELTVPIPHRADGSTQDLRTTLLDSFHQMHAQVYGHADPVAPVEVISVRVTGVGSVRKPTAEELTGVWRNTQAKLAGSGAKSTRHISLADEKGVASVYDRLSLQPDVWLSGPAVVEQYDTTIFIPREYSFTVDAFGNIVGRATTTLKDG